MNEDILNFQLQIFLFNFTFAKLQGCNKPRNQMIYHLAACQCQPMLSAREPSLIVINMFRKTYATSRNWYEFATVYIHLSRISIWSIWGPPHFSRLSQRCLQLKSSRCGPEWKYRYCTFPLTKEGSPSQSWGKRSSKLWGSVSSWCEMWEGERICSVELINSACYKPVEGGVKCWMDDFPLCFNWRNTDTS